MLYLSPFLLALMMMLLITPKLRRLAFKLDYLEKPAPEQQRKVHKESKPYLAGVGMFFTFWFVYLVVSTSYTFSSSPLGFTMDMKKTGLIFLGTLLIFITGMIDDWYKVRGKDLTALPKMLVQLTACAIIYGSGIQFTGFTNPFDGSFILLPEALQCFLTISWLFGVTTVINFTDGMDGLAGGIACIASTTLFVVALSKSNMAAALMAVILVGICLGYLRYNKYPSKILMGDCGATFLGFMLGIISLDGTFKQATVLAIFIPILALGIPIFDNLYVIVKRWREGRPVYVGDATQIHYRLHAKGLSHKQTVHFLYLGTICLNLCAIVLFLIET